MHFRIGVNSGDVIEQPDGTIYGDGVNIAARMESLAEPGGICISGKVFDEIETRLPLGYTYGGEQSIKNIRQPVRAYHVEREAAATSHGTRAHPSPQTRRRPLGHRRSCGGCSRDQ